MRPLLINERFSIIKLHFCSIVGYAIGTRKGSFANEGLEFVDYISPHQPGSFNHPKGINGRQFSTKSDMVSSIGKSAKWFGNSSYQKINGAEWGIQRESNDSKLGGHEVGSWLNNIIDYWKNQGIQVNVIE
ncbi:MULTISPECIES: hypothetical protein [Olivibacter]|uniref:Uncharacterized protein n=1 Tax=Olivibacter jilunii TaxID=985016 RepID=A0ABW6BD13_9SPHI